MKHLITIAVLFTIFVVATAEDQKKCADSSECEKNECCLFGRKGRFQGFCKALETEGNRCFEKPIKVEGLHIAFCPCAEGLECVGVRKKVLGMEVLVDEKCRKATL